MIERSLLSAGYTRRDFMKAVTTATAAMGLTLSQSNEVLAAVTENKEDKRPPVIWLHFQECTGCSEALLRADHPSAADLILDIANIEYQETLMAGAGHQAEESLAKALEKHKGKYILVVEGSIPLGIKESCMIGGHTAYDSFKKCAEGAAVIIGLGACAVSGGIVAIEPNPTKAVGVETLMKELGMDPKGKYLALPGCPPNPYNLLSVILYFATFGKLPVCDAKFRPTFAYGRLIHEHCERRPHFDAGRFVKQFGDDGHRDGWCLYHMGCKGPETHANCSIIHFNDGAAWPIGNGCPCIGCTEGDIFFKDSIFSLAKVSQPTPYANAPIASEKATRGTAATATQAAVVGGLVGAAVGAGAVFAAKLPKESEDENK